MSGQLESPINEEAIMKCSALDSAPPSSSMRMVGCFGNHTGSLNQAPGCLIISWQSKSKKVRNSVVWI